MRFSDDDDQAPLPLLGGVVQRQRLVVPPQVVMGIKSWRHACRLAWKLRNPRITQRTLAELVPGMYQSHVSDYFALRSDRRELPARFVAPVETVIGNTVMPSGARCRWYVDTTSIHRPAKGAAMFVYEREDGQPAVYNDEGFSLTRNNWRLLRRVA